MKLMILLLFPFIVQCQWKPTKNDLIIGGVQIVAGTADGLREEILYHPNNLFRQHPNLNREYWDSRISWKNSGWSAFKDANHTMRSVVQSMDILSIGVAIFEKDRNWKAMIRKCLTGG